MLLICAVASLDGLGAFVQLPLGACTVASLDGLGALYCNSFLFRQVRVLCTVASLDR